MDHYIDKKLSKWTRQRTKDVLLSWKNARPSVATIQDQDDSGLLTLQDIFTEEIYMVKVLDDDHPVETGGIVLAIILPVGETSVFFTSFVDLPASISEKAKDRVVQLFEESDETSYIEYLSLNYPEVLYHFIFGMEPDIEELDWSSPKHLEVAEEFKDYTEDIEDDTIIKLGIHLWYQYCSRKNPKIIKSSVYTAALIYLVDRLNPFGNMLTQSELAEVFDISSSSLSAKYRDMEIVLKEEIQELEDALDSMDYDEVYDDTSFEDDEEYFDNDEEPFWNENEKALIHSRMNSERELLKLENEMEHLQFESIDEVNNFMNQRLNHPDTQIRKLTNKEKAQELLFDAYESLGKKRTQLAEKALKLYPNSPDAYTILADAEFNPAKEEKLLLKAIDVGEKELGKDFFRKNMGHFWGIVSTRPYMRAKFNYAYLLQDTGRLEEAVQQYEDILELNPNDNQGVRFELFTIFVELGLLNKAEALLDTFNENMIAYGTYNRVLLEFLQNGASNKAKQLLQKAKEQNPFVPDYLLGKKNIPLYIPSSYQLGDEAEAVIYADQYFDLWESNPQLIKWLKKSK